MGVTKIVQDYGISTNYGKELGAQLGSQGVDYISGFLGDLIGGLFGNIFSSGLSTAGNTVLNNIVKKQNLTLGLISNTGETLAGSGVGLVSNYIGQGINSLGGNSMLSRGIGQGVSTGLGTLGGTMVSNLFKGSSLLSGFSPKADALKVGINTFKNTGDALQSAGAAKAAGLASKANLAGLGMSIVGSGLSAMFGPSKEYEGTYGNITKGMDTAYDLVQAGVGFIPGVGTAISGAMALNKGLSNIFGSTSGMTKQDAILGSAFMPAPVKWLNMAGAKTTDNFNKLSWQNLEKADTFMQNGFGDLASNFDKARRESGKTYGTFSRGAYHRALDNIGFANDAWDLILAMANLNEYLNIRAEDMTSINNQRYALMISGGYNPMLVGKHGMKILNNATNHNMGLRLLSAAALIDNKAMILSAQGGTKLTRLRAKPLPRKPATREENPELRDEWERREAEQQAARLKVYDLEQQAAAQRAETNARHALHYSDLVTGIAETAQQNAQFEPVTQESLQNSNTEQLRLEQLADKNEYFNNGMKFIEAAGFADLGVNFAAPLLQRGFKWAFNKAGLLVKVPLERTNLFLTSPYTGRWTLFGNKEYRFKPGYLGMNGSPIESRPIISEVNWDPDNWFKTISGRNSYSQEEAAELASHIPEYREIEKKLFDEGKLIIDSNGNIIVKGSEMSPQEYIMRQSKAFQKMNSEHHYVGVKKELRNSFENESRDPQTENRYEVWTDRKDPKNVEEYAYSGFDGDTVDSTIEKLKKLLDSYQNENGYYNSYWKQDLKEAEEMYKSGQIDKQYYDDWVNKINNNYNEEISRIKRDLKATIRQKETDPLNGGKVFDVTYPKDINETPIINAEGRNWAEIPYEYIERDAPDLISHYKGKPHPDEVQTDIIVNMAKRHGYPVTHINNVMDTGNGTLLDETIINKNVPVKSVLGNTGSFDINSPNKWKLYRSWLPWFLGGSTAATLYNTNK